jgi:hypothetical protein
VIADQPALLHALGRLNQYAGMLEGLQPTPLLFESTREAFERAITSTVCFLASILDNLRCERHAFIADVVPTKAAL